MILALARPRRKPETSKTSPPVPSLLLLLFFPSFLATFWFRSEAYITDPKVVLKILSHLHLPTEVPTVLHPLPAP
jgi:hypothetical protein